MTDQTETARALLYRHGLPDDVIDGALCLHAQELAAVQREAISKTDDPVFYEGEAGWLINLIEPDGTAPAVSSAGPAPADRDALRERIVQVLRTTPSALGAENPQLGFPSHHQPGESGYLGWCALCVRDIDAIADAVVAVLPAPTDQTATLRELEQRQRPNTPPSRPEPRLPDHTVNEEETPSPVKQRADCTELEWAEQERARFERLYTRETVRVDKAEQRAETAARTAEIYRKGLERLGEGYTEQRKRAERAEAEAERLRDDQAAMCICRHGEQQHFEDACFVCDCGDFLSPEAAREVIGRYQAAVKREHADRTAILNAAAQHLYTALFPAVYADLGQKAAEGVNRSVSELRRMAGGAQQAPADRATLSEAERTMLTYALNQAQLRIWSVGGVTDEEQAAVTSLRRLADEAQQDPTQDGETEAHPPLNAWRVETRDPLANEWAPGSQFASRPHAIYETANRIAPLWRDGTPVERRIVRETTTYTVEESTAVARPGQPETDRPPADTAQQPKEA